MYINLKQLTKLEQAIGVLKVMSNDDSNGLKLYKSDIEECEGIIQVVKDKEERANVNKAYRNYKKTKT